MQQNDPSDGCYALPRLHPSKQSIRLLKISEPEPSSSSPSLDIETFPFFECPSYKALSYTWGSPFPESQVFGPLDERFPSDEENAARNADWEAENKTVRCNGQLVHTGLNLFQALTHFSAIERGYIWIDRLCIDQNNLEERSSQVAIMSQIYSKASSVLIWLGCGGVDATAAMQIQDNFAGPVYDLFATGTLTTSDLQAHNPDDPEYWTKYKTHTVGRKVWWAWTEFFRRNWFYRRWTLQEQALAQQLDVWCGEYHLNWDKLMFLEWYFSRPLWRIHILRFLTYHRPTHAFLPRRFVQEVHSKPAEWNSGSVACFGTFNIGTILTEVLHRSCWLECSNPRDMIYALLGVIDRVSQTAGSFEISVNYNINVVDLYVSVFKICIENVPDLTTLSMVPDLGKRITQDLPSWVPDLAALAGPPGEKIGNLGLSRKEFQSPLYNAAFMSLTVPLSRSVQGTVLNLQGFHLGDVNNCSIDIAGQKQHLDDAKGLISFLDVCLGLPTILRDGQDRIQGLWRTIIADSGNERRPARPEFGAYFHDWILMFIFHIWEFDPEWPSTLGTISEKITQLSDTVTQFPLPDVGMGSLWWERLTVATRGHFATELGKYINLDNIHRFEAAPCAIREQLLFQTNGGDLGYGPVSMRPGDQVWVLENGRVPFVLRPVASGKNFELLGECYVHGVMDGQLFSNGMPVFEKISLV